MLANEQHAQAGEQVHTIGGVTLTTTSMLCGKTRYVVSGVLEAGSEVHLVDSDGRARMMDVNPLPHSRRVRLKPYLCGDPNLTIVVERSTEEQRTA